MGLVDQPTMRREYRSITTANWSPPSHVRTYVMSVTQALFGRGTVNIVAAYWASRARWYSL
jgi:hypothetical protein